MQNAAVASLEKSDVAAFNAPDNIKLCA